MRMHDYQTRVVTETATALDTTDRATIVSACGTGKTLMMQRLTETIESTLTVIAAPTIALAGQTWEAFTETAAVPFKPVVVCSDTDVVERSDAAELAVRVPVTTDGVELAALLARDTIVFTTHASLAVTAEALVAAGLTADLLLLDEAHRFAGARSQQRTLALDTFPATRRVFVTATPKVTTLDHYGQPKVELSMDNADQFGPQSRGLSLRGGIARGFLAPYIVRAIGVSESDMEALADIESDAGQIALHAAIRDGMAASGATRCLAFMSTIAAAERFAAAHPLLIEGASSWSLCGRDGSARRAEVFDAFLSADGAAVLCNARLFSEGVDTPGIDTVAFCCPKSSVVDIVQSVGRALRTDPNNPDKVATIIVPVVIPDGADADEIVAGSSIASVLLALRDMDEVLAEALDSAFAGDSSALDGIVSFDELGVVPDGLLDRVRSVVVGSCVEDGGWLRRCQEWADYFAEHGHHPGRSSSGRLARWLHLQRFLSRAGRMPDSREIAMANVDPDWRDDKDAYLDVVFPAVREWFDTHGHTPRPRSDNATERKLGMRWGQAVRHADPATRGKPGSWTDKPEYEARMPAFHATCKHVGFTPKWFQTNDLYVDVVFPAVREWFDTHGHTPRKRCEDDTERKLCAQWNNATRMASPATRGKPGSWTDKPEYEARMPAFHATCKHVGYTPKWLR